MGDPGGLPVDDPELEPEAACPGRDGLPACGTHSSERRKTSTMSNGPVAVDRLGQRRGGRHAEHLALVRVDRHAVVAVPEERPEDAVRRPVPVGRRADDRDPPGGAQDPLDAGVVEDGDRAAALLQVEEGGGAVALLARQVAASRSYGWPSAAGGMLRPTTPARTMIVTR